MAGEYRLVGVALAGVSGWAQPGGDFFGKSVYFGNLVTCLPLTIIGHQSLLFLSFRL
jgi:hypothetical protein